jgi:DNA invertase Pin-like site-specific DNA recombinase
MIFTSTKVSRVLAHHGRNSIERSTQNMLDFAQGLRDRGAGLRVLNLGGDVDTSTPMGSMLFTIMAALAQMEHDIKRERTVDSISKRRDAGKDLGGLPRRVTDSEIRSAVRLVEGGERAAQVARDLGMSARRSIEGRELSPTSRSAQPSECDTERSQNAAVQR